MSKQIEMLLDTPFRDIILKLKEADKVLHDTGTVHRTHASICEVAATALQTLLGEAESWRRGSLLMDFLDDRARFEGSNDENSFWKILLAPSRRNPEYVGEWEDFRSLALTTMAKEFIK